MCRQERPGTLWQLGPIAPLLPSTPRPPPGLARAAEVHEPGHHHQHEHNEEAGEHAQGKQLVQLVWVKGQVRHGVVHCGGWQLATDQPLLLTLLITTKGKVAGVMKVQVRSGTGLGWC